MTLKGKIFVLIVLMVTKAVDVPLSNTVSTFFKSAVCFSGFAIV